MIGIGIDYNKTKAKNCWNINIYIYMYVCTPKRASERIYIEEDDEEKESWEKFVVSLLLISL